MKLGNHPDLLEHCGKLPAIESSGLKYRVQCEVCGRAIEGERIDSIISLWKSRLDQETVCTFTGGPRHGERITVPNDRDEVVFGDRDGSIPLTGPDLANWKPKHDLYKRCSGTEFKYYGPY